MAVALPADIVMDVARAADPARFKVAVNRLESGGDYAAVARDVALAFAADDTAGFFEGAGHVRQPFDAGQAVLRLGDRSGAGGVKGSPYEQFEALTLQKFVEAMLPKESTAVFGKGFAGETWKSFLAEQMAAELARSGGIGIARMIEQAHPDDRQARAASEALSSANNIDDGLAVTSGLASAGVA
ncbi:rod-binding protein [Pseudochelatococcus contaminans]|uniref:Flagellar protein FlgJ N-terminal domain-containing protein n=1 Tax=Pseudochelatococcus contaminans TaxID=1538103 RepID=A0A7W5Z106_9HYPH|nr:rod-binding protein [Pseudochelatococcus contaminans]MBB3808003.1 hypothetical protein [Pseudochelatococcus contaminans]